MGKLDYYKIGQRIRKYRKAYQLSQEQLAEKIGISTTHLSHIETGNTKLSLPVLVDIASILSVSTDELLSDSPNPKTKVIKEIEEILDTCSPQEVCIIKELIKTTKISLDKYS